ncbi:hypothetical protein E2C01_010468 [Portunus trituberculatus]|uniref:Uncharacterized protein n=1 Tax=Portunus trituberculatus TaxID=210409 RepID=A0A5B7D8J5_PORTR|nr:hypothetical protein [Portunus trituberculatus]
MVGNVLPFIATVSPHGVLVLLISIAAIAVKHLPWKGGPKFHTVLTSIPHVYLQSASCMLPQDSNEIFHIVCSTDDVTSTDGQLFGHLKQHPPDCEQSSRIFSAIKHLSGLANSHKSLPLLIPM